jgi:segregation and condensation protein B
MSQTQPHNEGLTEESAGTEEGDAAARVARDESPRRLSEEPSMPEDYDLEVRVLNEEPSSLEEEPSSLEGEPLSPEEESLSQEAPSAQSDESTSSTSSTPSIADGNGKAPAPRERKKKPEPSDPLAADLKRHAEAAAARHETPPVESAAEARAVLECLLFTTTDPLPMREIRSILHTLDAKAIQLLLIDLQNDYMKRASGLQIVEVAGGYQMATRPRYAEWLAPLHRRKRKSGLSTAMLETLAIIAYKQPIIRAEVDAIRGVDSGGMMHTLLEIGLIEIVGQKQTPGRPNLYGTTKAFLKHFGLKSVSDLPSIDSLRERFELTQPPAPPRSASAEPPEVEQSGIEPPGERKPVSEVQ